MQFIHGCLLGTWTPLKIVFDDRNHFPIKLFSLSMHPPDKQFISTNNSIHLRYRHFWSPFLSCCSFPLLLVFLSQVRLVSQATSPWEIPTQPRFWFFILPGFFCLSKKRKKTPQKPEKPHPKPKQNQTHKPSNTRNKQTKQKHLETKLLFKI